jgi:hypothetical protein
MIMKLLTCLLTGLCLGFILSTAFAWEPREPEGAVPLSGSQINQAFSGQVAKGQDIHFVDKHNADGTLTGADSKGKEYSAGDKWWIEDDYICYTGPFFDEKTFCYNIAKGSDGLYYYYEGGGDRPDAYANIESLSN